MTGKLIHILLVEDNPGHAELIIRNLNRHPRSNEVHHVSSGEEALAYLFHQEQYRDTNEYPRPDIILLDLRLPGIDGLEVLKRIKSTETLIGIPVIILTTSRTRQDVETAYKHHASSYLVKPIDYTDFNNLLNDFGHYWFHWNQNLYIE